MTVSNSLKRTHAPSPHNSPISIKKIRNKPPKPFKSNDSVTRKTSIVASKTNGFDDCMESDDNCFSDLDINQDMDIVDNTGIDLSNEYNDLDDTQITALQDSKNHIRGSKNTSNRNYQQGGAEDVQLMRRQRDPAHPLVQGLKKMWERLRRSDLADEDRMKILGEMIPAITGNVPDLIFKHDSSRIIQCVIKYSNVGTRTKIANELQGRYVELSRSIYGRFIILRLLKYTPSVRKVIINEFHGHVAKNIKHIIASYVIEAIYTDYCNAKERYHMVQELYHPKFRQFKTETPLAEIIEKGEIEKHHVVFNLQQVVEPVIAKGILGDLSMVQRAVLDLLNLAAETERRHLMELLFPDLVAILHTREGSQVCICVLSHATAKDRKIIAKTFNGLIMKMANEEFGHLVLLEFLSTCDDTRLTQQAVLKEFESTQISQSKYFRKVILYILVGASNRHFSPDVLKQLIPNGKKDVWRKHSEILEYASPWLIDSLKENIIVWLCDPEMGVLALEIMMRAKMEDSVRTELVKMIAAALVSADRGDTLLRNVKNLVQYHDHWVKNQAKAKLKEGYSDEGHSCLFEQTKKASDLVATSLVTALGESAVQDMATSNGSFVILALIELEATCALVVPLLTGIRNEIALCKTNKGALLLSEVLQAKLL